MTVPFRTWDDVRALPRVPVATLLPEHLPATAGVYVWFRHGDPIYAGEARGAAGLRGRLRSHLAAGIDVSRSTLRRTVAEQQLEIPRSVSRLRPTVITPAQAGVVNAWLRECELTWIECPGPAEARALEVALRATWLPPLNRI